LKNDIYFETILLFEMVRKL